MMNSAEQIAKTQAELDTARTDYADRAAVVAKITARLTALSAQREALLERRSEGDSKPDDDAHHALLVADADRLAGLLIAAQQEAQQAKAGVDAASSARCEAQRLHDAAVTMTSVERLESRLREIEAVFLAGIKELVTLKRTVTPAGFYLHPREVYPPSNALSQFIVQGTLP